VDNPANPYPIVEYDTGWSMEVCVQGSHAYVTDSESGLVILDFTPCFE
jgi:hypothetical protein